MSKKKFILFVILYALFNICVNVAHPVTPDYVRSLELSEIFFGLFYAFMALGQVTGAILSGFLSDKYGRKWFIVGGTLGYCLSQAGFAYLNQYVGVILLMRFLSGLFAGAPLTLFISMCLDFSKDNKIKNLSIMTFANTLGAALAYEIGGDFYDYAHFSIQQVFLVQIVIGIITALTFALFIKEAPKEINENETQVQSTSKFSLKNFKNLNPLIYLLFVCLFIMTAGQILTNKYLDNYLTSINFDVSMLGHYICITGIIAAVSNLLIIPFIKKVKDNKLAVLLTTFVGISAAAIIITFTVKVDNILYLLCTTYLIYLILKSLITALEQNEFASYSRDGNNGQIMGARQTMLSIGNVIAPLIGTAAYVDGSPSIFIISGSIMFGSLILYIVYFIIKAHKLKNLKNIEK